MAVCVVCGAPVREGGGSILVEHPDGRYEHVGYCKDHRLEALKSKLGECS